MVKPSIDYSLYLVTGRDLLPAGKVRAADSPRRARQPVARLAYAIDHTD